MKNRIFLPIALISLLSFISCTKKVVEVRFAPVLYDLVAPDSVQRGSADTSYIFLSAYDPDGMGDIDSVYYQVTKPDNTTNGHSFRLHDDGQAGDSVAGDGRFTGGLYTYGDNSSQLGNYIFKFSAIDKNGDDSNHPQATINFYVP